MMYVVCVDASCDGCDLASISCRYDLKNDDSFVLSWARVRRVR